MTQVCTLFSVLKIYCSANVAVFAMNLTFAGLWLELIYHEPCTVFLFALSYINKTVSLHREWCWFYKAVWTINQRGLDTNSNGIHATKFVSSVQSSFILLSSNLNTFCCVFWPIFSLYFLVVCEIVLHSDMKGAGIVQSV